MGGIANEFWSKPSRNSMIGMFRFIKGGKIVFSEFIYLIEERDSVFMKIKHFTGDFSSWEHKDKSIVFPSVSIDEKTAVFDGITYSCSQCKER